MKFIEMAEKGKEEGIGCLGIVGIGVFAIILIAGIFGDDEKSQTRKSTTIEENRVAELTNNPKKWIDYHGNGFSIRFPVRDTPTINRKGNNAIYSSSSNGIDYSVGEINFEPGFANTAAKGKNDWLESFYKSQAGITAFRQTRSILDGTESMEFSYFNSGNSKITIGKTYVAKKNMYFAATSFLSSLKSGYTDSDAITFRNGLKIAGTINQETKAHKLTETIKNANPALQKCLIKGNVGFGTSEKLYHLPGDPFYESTVINTNYGEKWFCTEGEAIAAGWRHAKSGTVNEQPARLIETYQGYDENLDSRGYDDYDYQNDDPYEDYQEEEEPEPDYYDDYYDSYDGIR